MSFVVHSRAVQSVDRPINSFVENAHEKRNPCRTVRAGVSCCRGHGRFGDGSAVGAGGWIIRRAGEAMQLDVALERRCRAQRGDRARGARLAGYTSACSYPRAAIPPIAARVRIWFADAMIRKLPSGQYRLYSRKIDPRTKRRKNLGTFPTRAAAEKHERAVQFFKRRG